MRSVLIIILVVMIGLLFNGCGRNDNGERTENREQQTTEKNQGSNSPDENQGLSPSPSRTVPPSSPPDILIGDELGDKDIKKTVAKYFTDYSFDQGLQYIYDADDFRIETEVSSDTYRYVFANLIKGKNSNMLKISRETGELGGYCIFEHVAIDDGEAFEWDGAEYLLLAGHTDHPDYRDEYDSYYGDIREYYAIRYGSFFLVPTDGVDSKKKAVNGWDIAEVEVQLHEDMNSTISKVDIIDDIVRYEKDWEGLSENGVFEISLESLFL